MGRALLHREQGHSSGDRSRTLSTTSNHLSTQPQYQISQHTTQAILHSCPHTIPQLSRATPAPTSSFVLLFLLIAPKGYPALWKIRSYPTLHALSWAPSQRVRSHALQKIMGNPHYHRRPIASVRETMLSFASLPLTRTRHLHPSYLG